MRRNEKGEFTESDDVGRSLRQDVKQKAKTVVKGGYGDKGDQMLNWNSYMVGEQRKLFRTAWSGCLTAKVVGRDLGADGNRTAGLNSGSCAEG